MRSDGNAFMEIQLKLMMKPWLEINPKCSLTLYCIECGRECVFSQVGICLAYHCLSDFMDSALKHFIKEFITKYSLAIR